MTEESSKPDHTHEPVWTYRGYELHAGEFNTAMVHLFRAEVSRANVWRQRLDTTTNWAVITTGAVVSLAFTQAEVSHLVILLNLLLLTIFLITEARRYRYYELWSSRVRMMETDFFAAMLVPPFKPAPDWAEGMAESLLQPEFPISELEALGRRLRRNYLWIYLIVGIAWLAKLSLFPKPIRLISEIVEHAGVGGLNGELVISVVAGFYIFLFLLTFMTIGLRRASGEVLTDYGIGDINFEKTFSKDKKAWFKNPRRRQQLLTLIVTDNPEQVCQRIMEDMQRGATVLPAEGAYTHTKRTVLMVALTITEVPQLKALVADVSPSSFVVVVPAKSVFGGGFMPLEEK
ncbi:MAG: DUF2270 domain-containing protein [Anaerolineae bacterium]|jgi:uncharacterized membrane protein|nr:DUF2270 domain-containing protein [Anaerolineae bacterium]MBT7070064.1 DUF2270 domain-containing protein [Anaerolineae bacterium]MBT7323597.1 DUF2270 domain-containing protein [Anaerolineae bacterium]